jgi:hypothetical protein
MLPCILRQVSVYNVHKPWPELQCNVLLLVSVVPDAVHSGFIVSVTSYLLAKCVAAPGYKPITLTTAAAHAPLLSRDHAPLPCCVCCGLHTVLRACCMHRAVSGHSSRLTKRSFMPAWGMLFCFCVALAGCSCHPWQRYVEPCKHLLRSSSVLALAASSCGYTL